MIRYVRNANPSSLRGTALVRLDFNTEDTWRLKASVPTLTFLAPRAGRLVIMGHKGRPKGFDKKFTLAKNVPVLSRLLGRKVLFISHVRFPEIKKVIATAPRGSVFLLENLRFLKGEETNDRTFAKRLASLVDYYVNDAFAVSHRANASVAAITKFLPSYAGFEMEAEFKNLELVMKRPKKPLVLILGGAKAGDKLDVLKFFKDKADYLLLGGAAANTLLAMRGVNIKKSVSEIKDRKRFTFLLKSKNVVLPIDWVMSGGKILDSGPKTNRLFAEKVRDARTIIWNGPLGMIEKKRFTKGTLALVRAIAKNKHAFSVTGGGETVMFLKKHHLDKKFSFISTGGGAMLDFLAGKKLPGVEALKR